MQKIWRNEWGKHRNHWRMQRQVNSGGHGGNSYSRFEETFLLNPLVVVSVYFLLSVSPHNLALWMNKYKILLSVFITLEKLYTNSFNYLICLLLQLILNWIEHNFFLCFIDIHTRDIIDELLKGNVVSEKDFLWKSRPRWVHSCIKKYFLF